MSQVSFICKRTVVSTKPVEKGKFHCLSVLDNTMENNHLTLVLYYNSPPGMKLGDLTSILRESISSMLCAFPMVTGRLLKNPQGQWMIKCNDAGIRMIEARAKGSVDEWLQNVDSEKELKLVYWESMLDKVYFWSTFYVQVTEFEEGGFAIGLSCAHLLADPICATNFIKAWADTTLTGKMINPPLFHPLPPPRPANTNTNHKPYTQLINHYKTIIHRNPPKSNVKHTTISLKFNDETVRKCIDMAKDPNSSNPTTPFQALAGLFWICISKVKGIKSGLIDMSLCLDMRKVIGLEKCFFGNCMVYNKVELFVDMDKVNLYGECLPDKELSKAVANIRNVEMKMDNEGIQDLIGWLEQNDYKNPPWMNGYELICANMESIDTYSAIFEDGLKPIHASYYIEPALGEGQILILPSPSSEGSFSRVVMVTLPRDEVTKLLDLQLIQQMSSTILMGANTDN